MLMPKRIKYRKTHRGRRKGPANRGTTIAFGEFGLVAEESAWIESKQIEAARRAITHFIKRGGQVWIRIFARSTRSRRVFLHRAVRGAAEPPSHAD